MRTLALSNDVVVAARTHLNILDEHIAVVQKKLEETVNPFARDSLKDLLGNLADQRDSYVAVTELAAIAA
ncbi:MAG TPA: hypothetical protein VD978_13860 [Azospirillum sp.]|nr:hypothetical protein [Azospirillum sp.]